MMAFYKCCFPSIIAVAALVPTKSFSQYRGGNDDGTSIGVATNQPMGRNIFLGGNDDGLSTTVAINQPMGRNIFLGGDDDGVSTAVAINQPMGRNIFLGGNDDGLSTTVAINQPMGRNIFLGGDDDGISTVVATNQPLGRSIFYGGVDDGWAMAFASNVPLPITLTDFNGQWQQNDALLFWKTSSELNSSHFELERSFDGRTYNSIQRIAAAGQSSVLKNYQYIDVNLKKLLPIGVTTVYYRLRSVDRNGEGTYSAVVVLKTSNTNEIEYAVFPNPAKDFVTITASQLPAVDGAYIRMADATGKVLALQKMTASRQQISVSAYPNGTYFLQLVAADKVVYTQKIIIRK
jgi:hypothetical protein